MKRLAIACLAWIFVSNWVVGYERPNIVFFLIDDQTISTLGCYGNSIVQTPNIDGLAKRGMRFENAFVCQSICWVSRTTLLTGLTGRSYGTAEQPDVARSDAVEVLCSDLLRQSGYRTGFIGKWHAKMPSDFKNKEHFDVFESISRDPYFKTMPDGSLRHETDLIVDRGIDFVRSQPKGEPFALNLWFNACHGEDGDRRPGIGHFPWPSSANGLYEDMQMPKPKLSQPEVFESLPEFLKTSITRERYFWRWNTDYKYQMNMRAYYRMTTGIDHAIGRFVKELEQSGLAENTIIVYSADNGYFMGNRGLSGKWSHFDESLRVPLIIMDPRVDSPKRGTTTDALSLNLDLPATFLDWAKVPVPATYQGRSLRPIVEAGAPEDWRTETFHEHFAVRNRIPAFEGLRTLDFKYARYMDHGDFEFLHDLRTDPNELVNLASDQRYSQTLTEFRQRTDTLVEQFGGPLGPLNGKFQASTVPHPKASATVGSKVGDDGFMSLFDGKTLNRWTGDNAFWSVEDGAITGKTDGSLEQNRFITFKDSTVRNFDLRMQVKISSNGNSGIQYRGLSRPELGLDIVSGYQCDVVADHPNYDGMLYEERGRRILGHKGEKVVIDTDGSAWIVARFPTHDVKSEQWHEYRVLVQGNQHQHWIDDQLTSEVIDLDQAGRSLEGVLAMQVHVGPAMKVQYRDLRIRHLPDDLSLKKPNDVAIPATAEGVRPQADLPADWQPPTYGKRNVNK